MQREKGLLTAWRKCRISFWMAGFLLILMWTGARFCFAETLPADTATGQEPAASEDNGPEPPSQITADLSGEGMIGPSADATKDSVFGQASEEEPFMDEQMEKLIPQVESSLPAGNGSWSVFLCDLVSGAEGSIGETPRQAASLIKLYIMGAVYERYDQLIQQYGQNTVDANLYSMITVSDNDAANTLTGFLGGGDSASGMQAVNAFCAVHGFHSTSMGRLLLQSNAYGDNYTSAADCGHFLREIYLENTEEYPYAEEMFSLLAAQTRRNKIPAQMPSGVSVANKTGELSDVENDAGIIYNAANDLIIVFLSENLSQPGAAQSTIASISRAVYDYYNGSGGEQ